MPVKPDLRRKIVTERKTAEEIINNLKAVATFLKNNYLEREDTVRQLLLAVLTKQHVLLFGEPGTAKSRIVTSFMSCFEGANTFRKQLSRYLPEEAIIGSLNPKLLREEGIYEYNTTGTLVDAHLAYLDEVFDGNDSTLRSMLEILNERQFTKGHQKLECPLVSCFMASNFHREDKNVEAFIDRILFRSMLTGIVEKGNKISMLKNFICNDETPKYDGEKISMADLDVLHEALNSVTMADDLIDTFVSFVGELCTTLSIKISDRKINQLTYVLKASALLQKRQHITFDDFLYIKYGLLVLGKKLEEEDLFDKLYAHYAKNIIGIESTVDHIEKDLQDYLNKINLADKDRLKQNVEDLKKKFDIVEKGEQELGRAGAADAAKINKARARFKQMRTAIDEKIDQIIAVVKAV